MASSKPALTFTLPDKKFEFVKILGSGSYGSVAAFRDKERNVTVAVKRITRAFDDFLVGRRTLREIKLMRHFKHPNLLQLVDALPVSRSSGEVFMITHVMDWDLD